MKTKKYLIVGLLCTSILATGCGKEISTKEFELKDTEDVKENVLDINDSPFNEENIGELYHGVDWSEDEEDYSFVYEGGEMQIPYSLTASGICTNTGFLIYLNGIPQPYKVSDMDEEYKYLHVIEAEDGKEKKFVFTFIPVTGKAGDKMQISINSIADPSFVPDMKNTFTYGMSQQSIEAVYDISFTKEAEELPSVSDTRCILSKIDNKQMDIDEEEKSYIEEKSIEEELDLDKSIYNDLRIDGNSMLLDDKADILNKDKMHVTYTMMGHPGVKYRVSFYLDHQLLSDGIDKPYEMELVTGKMNTVSFDMDISSVTDGTFYVVAVPINANDYPEDSIGIIKHQPIHLYRGDK